MSIDALHALVVSTQWFQRLGEADDLDADCIRTPDLASWADGHPDDRQLDQIAETMEWLPSSPDQADPVHGSDVEQKVRSLGQAEEWRKTVMEICAATLVALRSFDGHHALRTGPHDFTAAARGAALYAVRRAAYETLLDEPGFWCRAIGIYGLGHWPCGLLPDGRIVVL